MSSRADPSHQERVLFVCLGNICRSPTAEGVFRSILPEYGLEGIVEADSAGTHGYHLGASPDQRAREAAARRGIRLDGMKARQVSRRDFQEFDRILAMDQSNLLHLQQAAPPQGRDRVRLFLDYAPNQETMEVPDPYFGGDRGFEVVLDLVEEAARGLAEAIREARGLRS